jgi:hypothetical protein
MTVCARRLEICVPAAAGVHGSTPLTTSRWFPSAFAQAEACGLEACGRSDRKDVETALTFLMKNRRKAAEAGILRYPLTAKAI